MSLSIRPEGPADAAAIRRVLEAAFPTRGRGPAGREAPGWRPPLALPRGRGGRSRSSATSPSARCRSMGLPSTGSASAWHRSPSSRIISAGVSAAASSARASRRADAPDTASWWCWASRSSIDGSASIGPTGEASGTSTGPSRSSWCSSSGTAPSPDAEAWSGSDPSSRNSPSDCGGIVIPCAGSRDTRYGWGLPAMSGTSAALLATGIVGRHRSGARGSPRSGDPGAGVLSVPPR